MRAAKVVLPVVLLCAVIHAAPARATSAVVPDEYPSIQAAIDAGVDSVLVRDGTYAEHPVIPRSLALLTEPPEPRWGQPPFPKVAGLTVSCPSLAGPVLVRDFHFTGAVTLGSGLLNDWPVEFSACRMDSGLTDLHAAYYDGVVNVRGCLVFGGIWLGPLGLRYVDVSGNSIIGGGLRVDVDEMGAIRGNYIQGPAAAGIWIVSSNADVLPVSDNVVAGTTDGIVLDSRQRTPYGDYHDNTVRDCPGSAFRALHDAGMSGSPKFRHNTVRHCGGHGIELTGVYAAIDSNDIEDVGMDGIHAVTMGQSVVGNRVVHVGGNGIWLGDFAIEVSGNRVIDAGADGLALAGAQPFGYNVAGRCAGAGIRITTQDFSTQDIAHNTVYLNQGAGLDVGGAQPQVQIHHNIAYGNQGAGLAWSGTGTAVPGCNDWEGNGGGATAGVAPGLTDVSLEPAFCDLPYDSVSLALNSPLLDAPGCGQIGALGAGCGPAADVGHRATPVAAGLTALPQPSAGPVRFAWSGIDGPGVLELYDPSGRRRWSADIRPGERGLDWSGLDAASRPLAPGVYFARLVGAGVEVRAKVVRVR